MDVVYLFKEDTENNSEELRYSLRSLKNVPHGKVFIAGEKPDWATNVIHIPVVQSKTKSENWGMNMSAAVRSRQVFENFIMMNDDFFIMKPMTKVPNLHFGNMKQVIALYDKRYPDGSDYILNMKKLYEMLTMRGYSNPISYELHIPMIINKQNVIQLYKDVANEPLYQFRTFYGNYFAIGGTPVNDVKVFLDSAHNDPDYNSNPMEYLKKQAFLSATGGSFKRGLVGNFVRNSFPEKSMYEI